MSPSLNAVVPMACITAAGIAAMTAEAFRAPGERMSIGPLGIVGLIGAAVATFLLWGHDAGSFGVVRADNFALFVTGVLIVVGVLSIAVAGPGIERDRLPGGEYYALLLFSLAGMVLMAMAVDLLADGVGAVARHGVNGGPAGVRELLQHFQEVFQRGDVVGVVDHHGGALVIE